MTIDWKNAPEGATHYSPETDATHAVFYKDDFKQMWIEKWSNLGWQEAHSLNEHERPIPRPTSTAIPVSEQTQTLEAELSAQRTQAIADAARIAELEASLAARAEVALQSATLTASNAGRELRYQGRVVKPELRKCIRALIKQLQPELIGLE